METISPELPTHRPPRRSHTHLADQGRQARDLSQLLFSEHRDPREASHHERESARRRVAGFHRTLQRLHALPPTLRGALLLFDELDARIIGEEYLVEPIAPVGATRLDQLPRPDPHGLAPERVLPWILRLLDILVQLQLHGIPSHLLLRPECIHITADDQGVLIGDLGLSELLPHYLDQALRQPALQIYAAPELIGPHARVHGDRADIHSLGCIAARLLLPADEFSFLAMTDPRDKYVLPPPLFLHRDLPPGVAEILAAMASADSHQRPPLFHARAALAHAWRRTGERPTAAPRRCAALARLAHTGLHAPREELRAALDVAPGTGPPDETTPEALRPLLPQLLSGAPPLRDPARIAAIDHLGALLVSGESPELLYLGLLAVAAAQLGAIDPAAASAVLVQVSELLARDQTADEILHVLVAALTLEAALACGRAAELWTARAIASRPVTVPASLALMTALRGLADVALGRIDAAQAAFTDACVGAATAPKTGALHHALVRLELHIRAAALPLGLRLVDARQNLVGELHDLPALAAEECAARIFPQLERPASLLLQTLGGARGGRAPRRRSAATRWRRLVLAGLFWEQRNFHGLAIRRYTRALELLPIDTATLHHVELHTWLGSSYPGLSTELIGIRALALAAEWTHRLPCQPPRIVEALHIGAQFFAGYRHTPRRDPTTTAQSLLDGLDAEVTANPGRVAHWIMLRLLAEFRGMCATLTLLNVNSQPLSGSLARPRSAAPDADFAAALAACGWFAEMSAAETSQLQARLHERLRDDPLSGPLALSAAALPLATWPTADAQRRAERTLRRVAGLDDVPDDRPAPSPRSPDALVRELNAGISHTTRRLQIIPMPGAPDVLHVAFVQPAAFVAASEAGLLYFHFTSVYSPRSETMPLLDSAMELGLGPIQALQGLQRARYNEAPLPFAADTLVCRAQINRGMLCELRFSAHLYRTFDDSDRRALAGRLAELVPAFMLVRDWSDRAPPVPTQLRVLHLMAHEAKRPLLWMQKSLTGLCRDGRLGRDGYRELEGLLDVCVSRLAIFCGSKMWDLAEFALVPRIGQLLHDWGIALTTSGEELELGNPLAAQPQLQGLPPLWLRGQAVELILSELLENARKYSQPRSQIDVALQVVPHGARCQVEFTVRNRVKRTLQVESGQSPLFVERFSSTGLGMQLLSDLVRQLDDGRVGGSGDPRDDGVHVTRFSFTAPFAGTAGPPPASESRHDG